MSILPSSYNETVFCKGLCTVEELLRMSGYNEMKIS